MQEEGNDVHGASMAEQAVEGGSQVTTNCDDGGVPPTIRTVTRGDQTYTMNVSRIGKRSVPPPSFAEVRVEGGKPETESPSPSPFGVVIVLSSGDRLFLPEACDPCWIGQVVRALRSGPC